MFRTEYPDSVRYYSYFGIDSPLSRDDGPAVIYSDGKVEWWLDGKQFPDQVAVEEELAARKNRVIPTWRETLKRYHIELYSKEKPSETVMVSVSAYSEIGAQSKALEIARKSEDQGTFNMVSIVAEAEENNSAHNQPEVDNQVTGNVQGSTIIQVGDLDEIYL